MKNIYLILFLNCFFISNVACAQFKLNNLEDAKKLEINKNEFIGKSLNNLLDAININIVSVIPSPNKNPNEVNRISFLFVSKSHYKNSDDKPTRITVTFNQNWGLLGERCTYERIGCTSWTQSDRQKLGNLIVHDIYVSGKN